MMAAAEVVATEAEEVAAMEVAAMEVAVTEGAEGEAADTVEIVVVAEATGEAVEATVEEVSLWKKLS